ncbi:MAG TPA: hypothetical protein VMV05_08020 [bacterium]|nr:hypothetical protein [bacterium]
MRPFLVLLILFMLGGCAAIGVKDSSLELKISPQPVQRGKPALAQVNAPLDATKVIGTVLTFGSPKLEFRKDEEKRLWYFYGTIPFSPWVKAGTYQVRVIATLPQGQPHYTEMKVELK